MIKKNYFKTSYNEFIYLRTYARWLESQGRCERWDETVQRYMDFMKENPDSRRHLVVAYNPGEVDKMALPPCHCLFQFYVSKGKLSCQLYQRSADVFLGVPFNIASYSILTHMVAQQCALDVGEFVWTGGDVHLYKNHTEQAREQISRDAKPFPKLELAKAKDIFSYKYDDFQIEGYEAHPNIKAEVAI